MTAAQAALSGGTLTTMRFVALMAGLDGTVSDFRNTARNAAFTAIGTDAGLIASTLRMLASASPAVSYLSSLANFINALGDRGSLDLATVLQTIRAEVSAGNLTAAASIRLGEALVYYAYGLTSNRDSVFASEVVAQIDAGLISATSAVAALGAVRDEFGVYEADRHLMDLVSARNTATIRIAVAQQIAASVYNIDPNVMDPASQGNRILVSNAIGFIRGRIDAGITATDATTMLTAVAALGGYALRAIGDNLRTNAPGTATIDTVAAAADALGLTAAQKITVLAGIGGSSAMQLQGNSSVWVANTDFQTAAAGWILGVANTAHMSAADLAGAFIAALPDAAGGGNLYWQEIGRVLIDMATVGSNPDAAQARYVGAAIAAYVTSGPVGVASMIGLIDGMVRISQTMTVDQSLSVLIGMAANGGLAVQAAAAGEIADLATRNVMQLATGVTAITSALNASILTNARAATLLAGIVGASAIGTVGTAAIDALVTLTGSSTSTLTDAIQAAVTGSALSLDAALRVYAEVAGRSSATVQGAITTAMLSLVPSNGIEAAITTLATEAATGTTGVQIAIGREIAAFVAQGGVTGARAIALIDGLIGANTLTAARALAVLVGFGAGDSGRETLVQTEIATLVTNGAITAAAAVSALQGLQSGAASDVSTVIDDALAGLITDPASLAQTAGLGTPAQVLLVARTIAGYMSTDPTAAATILDGLSPRIRAGSLTGAQAARLLIDVAAQGGGAQTVAILRLTVLATVQQGQSAADVALSDITGQVSALLGAGTLGSAIALDVLDHLISLGGAQIRSAIAGLVGTDSTSSITVAQIAAAVGNASLSDSDAISILGLVAKANGGALQASAISQIATLATDPTTVQQAVDAFAAIGSGATAAIRAAGYTALNTLLGANAGLADRAFNAILPFAGAGDAGVRADAVAEIATLVGSLGLSTTTVLTEINAQLASSAAVLTANQALAVLVGLLGVPAAESTVFQAIDSIASNNHYSQQTPRPGFTAEAAITAIAGAYGDDSARAATTAQELRVLKTLVGTPSFLGALAGVAASTQFTVLSNLLPNADADTSTAYIQRIVTLLAGMSSTDATTARTGLLNNSALSAAQAAQLAVAYYVSGSASAFLSAAGSMNAGVLTGGIADLVTAGTVSVLSAQEMLAVLATQGTAGLKSSAVTKLSDALVGQTSLATALISHISGFIDSAVLTGAQAVGLFARMLLSNPSALGSALQTAELDLITQGKIGYLDALTAVAETAAGVNASGMATVAQEIAGILSGRTIDASRVADAIAAPAGGPSPSLTTAQDVALLIAVGGAVGEPMLTAAGRKIGAFAAAGSIAGDAAGYAIYQAKVDGLVTAAQGVAIAIGALAGGSPAAANAAIYQFLYQNAISASDVTTALDGAVAAGTITATATVDLAESFLNTSISTDATVAILSTLITNARATGAAVVGELGSFIGTVGATISPALFMSVVAKVATSAARTSGADASIGLGLADLIAANKITKAQVSDGLVLAVNGATTPVQIAATLSFANALTMLVGMAADTATAAVTAGVAGTAGSLAAALAGSDATRLADAETAFDGAKTAGTLTAAQLLKVYAGLVGAGVSASATGVHLAGLVAAGTLSVYDLYTLNGLLPADTYTTVIASAALTMIAAGGTTTLVRQALENDLFAVVGTDNGQISSTTSLSLIGAAGTAIGTPSSATALLLTEMGQYPTRLAFGVGAGAELARQVAAGSVSASDALSSASVAMLAGMAEADRLQVASVSSTFRDLIYATLQARAAAPMTASVAATLVQLITDGALSAANGLDVIAQAAHRFGQSFALNLGGALKPLLVAGTVTPTQIGTALSDAGIAGTEAIVFLASMIDPRQINAGTLLSRQILDATRDLLTTSGTTAGVQALTTALAGPSRRRARSSCRRRRPSPPGRRWPRFSTRNPSRRS
ncbi:beta strand repeat-containing protein [Methyloraptor flagellatus]|uniref:Uncharacterized protein n=1 Tax=Methyloraptor flagellatus TaxID=3162530 RepID=A0AAU7XDT9_9HYPH